VLLKYVKNSSPQQTGAVCRNLLEAMDQSKVDVLSRDVLEAIVERCDDVLAGRVR
jgi:hypothetical protein